MPTRLVDSYVRCKPMFLLSRVFRTLFFACSELHRVGWAGGSPTPWTPWFFDIAWDATFVMQEQQTKRFVLLCMTDTD